MEQTSTAVAADEASAGALERPDSPPVDRKYIVGLVAGALLGLAFGFPGAYALFHSLNEDPVRKARELVDVQVSRLLSQSDQALKSGQPQRAILLLSDAQRIDSKNESIQNNLCVAYTGLGRYDDAIAACNFALLLRADFQLARNNLAWAQSERARTQTTASAAP